MKSKGSAWQREKGFEGENGGQCAWSREGQGLRGTESGERGGINLWPCLEGYSESWDFIP